jgi:hypothetical protein
MSLKKSCFIIAGVMGCLAVTCGDACAWGAGIHIAQGEFVLNHLDIILPAVAGLLRSYSRDFLYGCISADIFIGKGSRKRDNHCHNWAVGRTMLEQAQEPFEKAFTYGYLSHLAADTVAHNFYVPNQLYRTSSTRKVGHLYWECRADIFTQRRHWQLAKEVITAHNPRDDKVIGRAVRNRVLPFKTKKQIYAGTIRLYDLSEWRRAVELFSRNSRWGLSREYVDFFKHLSCALTIDFLRDPDHALCLAYDPVGSDSIREAKRRRRLVRKLNGRFPQDTGFAIPEELLAVAASVDAVEKV